VWKGNCKKKKCKTKATMQGANEGENFGYAVSMDRDGVRYAVSAPALTSSARTGAVSVYDNEFKTVGKKLKGSKGDGFGMSLSMSSNGKFLAVGAPLQNYVQVYKYNSGKKQFQTMGDKIRAQDSDPCDSNANVSNNDDDGDDDGEIVDTRFGHSLSFAVDQNNDKFVAIGVPSRSTTDYVEVYQWRNSKWKLRGDTICGDKYDFGASVSLSDDARWISIGDPEYEQDGQQARGRTLVYKYKSNNKWVKEASDIVGAGAFDNTGFATSLKTDSCGSINVAVASPFAEPDGYQSGAVAIVTLK